MGRLKKEVTVRVCRRSKSSASRARRVSDERSDVRNPVRRLEAQRFDATGLVPRSEAWYEFYWDKMDRLLAGEDIGMRIPLEAFDEMMRRGEVAEQERKAPVPRVRGRRNRIDSGIFDNRPVFYYRLLGQFGPERSSATHEWNNVVSELVDLVRFHQLHRWPSEFLESEIIAKQ